MGSISFPNTATDTYDSAAGWIIPDGDWAFVLDLKFDSSPVSFPTYITSGSTGSGSTINVFGNPSDQLAVTVNDSTNLISYEFTVVAPLVGGTWYRLIVARVGDNISQWFGEPGDATAALVNTADITGFGAITTPTFRLGSGKSSNNPMQGNLLIPQLATGTMDQAKANALVNLGGNLGSQAGMTDVNSYPPLADSGAAPASIADTVGSNDYTIFGALTLGAGPVFASGANVGWVSLVPLRLSGTIQASTLVDIVVRPNADSPAVIPAGTQVTTSAGGIITIDNDAIGIVGGLVDVEVGLPATTNNLVFKAQTIVDLDA